MSWIIISLASHFFPQVAKIRKQIVQIPYKPNGYYSTSIYVGTPEIREVSWNGGWGEIDLYAIFTLKEWKWVVGEKRTN